MRIADKAIDSLEFTLYCTSVCVCDSCGVDAELPPVDSPIWRGDVNTWAHDMAVALRELGWTPRAWDRVRCMRCSSRHRKSNGAQN